MCLPTTEKIKSTIAVKFDQISTHLNVISITITMRYQQIPERKYDLEFTPMGRTHINNFDRQKSSHINNFNRQLSLLLGNL
jgi:hypothetical protein